MNGMINYICHSLATSEAAIHNCVTRNRQLGKRIFVCTVMGVITAMAAAQHSKEIAQLRKEVECLTHKVEVLEEQEGA